ncbi:MAG: tail fiber domain-containing protein, partial [Bacteroidota bacterium]
MKTKILFFCLTICIVYGTARAQDTSYGGLIAPGTTAGTAGDGTNSYLGHQAGLNTTAAGSSNTFTGYQSGFTNTIGSFNTATGVIAFFNNTTGHNNTANGGAALFSNTSGGENTASGVSALFSNTTGSQNTAYGYQTLYSNTEGNAHTAIGYQALYSSNTGEPSTAIGYQALYFNGPDLSGGFLNTAAGYQALFDNTEGNFNTATGHQALYSNTEGDENTANGWRALGASTTGNHNTASGYESLYNNTTGDYNTAVGYRALYYGSGNHNTGIGQFTGTDFFVGPGSVLSGTIAIGSSVTVTADNQARIGSSSIGGYAPWTNLSDARFKEDIKEDIPGLGFIIQLRPVSYTLDRAKLRTFLGKEQTEENAVTSSYGRSIGFVAQEVEQLLNENKYTRIGIEPPQNDRDHYTIRYSEFVVPLVRAMQEQQQSIETQQKHIETLQQHIETLENVSTDNTTESFQNKSADSTIEGFSLHQNTPNPFNRSTTITAIVPRNVQQAKIVIYNLNGLELERYDINRRGNVSVEISAARFPSGTYLYALLADD